MSLALGVGAQAQAGRRAAGSESKKNTQEGAPEAKPEQTPAPRARDEDEPQDVGEGETVRVETNLVTLPVIASDRGGRYVPDLKAEEFTVTEDGAEQKLSFFATVSAPFRVVLMIDTSASATVEKLRLVRADLPSMLPHAFRQIAGELRTQYSLGCYPTNPARDGKYRKPRVRTTRRDVALRTRPGYRAGR